MPPTFSCAIAEGPLPPSSRTQPNEQKEARLQTCKVCKSKFILNFHFPFTLFKIIDVERLQFPTLYLQVSYPSRPTTRHVRTYIVHHLHLRDEEKKNLLNLQSFNTALHMMQAFLQSCMHPHTLQKSFFPKEITK